MAIGTNSYGSIAAIQGLVKKYTTEGSFDGSSHPTLTQVEGYVDRVSGILNVMLAQQGFTIPVSQASAKLALDEFVDEEAASLCEAANSSGRFFGEESRALGPWTMITEDAEAFVMRHAQGLEDLGAARSRHLATAWMGDKPIAIAEVA